MGIVRAAVAVVIILVGVNKPSGFWTSKHHARLFVVALVVVGVATFVRSIYDYLSNTREHHRRIYEKQIEEILAAGFIRVVTESALDFKDIGIHAFMVRRWPRSRQVRIAKIRLAHRQSSNQIKWVRGKGLIGKCWENRDGYLLDVSELRNLCLRTDEKTWDALDSETRLGMTHRDFKISRTSGTIMATPILDTKGNYQGCVSLDAPSGSEVALNNNAVWTALAETARMIWLVDRKMGDL